MDNHPNVGLVMPQILYPNGKIQYLCKLLPTPIDLIIRRFIPISSYQEKVTINMNYVSPIMIKKWKFQPYRGVSCL